MQKEKMIILNIISTIKVLFAILQDRHLAKAELVACNSQAEYLQLLHKVKYLQPGEGESKSFSPPLPMPLLGKAKPNIIPAQRNLEALD